MVPGGTNTPPNLAFHPFPDETLTNQYSFADLQCVPTSVPVTSRQPIHEQSAGRPAGQDPDQCQQQPGLVLRADFGGELPYGDGVQPDGRQRQRGHFRALLLLQRGRHRRKPGRHQPAGAVRAGLERLRPGLEHPVDRSYHQYHHHLHERQTPISTNSYTVTNDYRVAIIANQATPTTPAQVWDLSLHGSNNIVISDVYNVLDNLSLDCVGLTLTTNGPDAHSPMGVLNLQSTMESWTAATPNLRYLTNYGDILLPLTGAELAGPLRHPGGALRGAPELRAD